MLNKYNYSLFIYTMAEINYIKVGTFNSIINYFPDLMCLQRVVKDMVNTRVGFSLLHLLLTISKDVDFSH